MYRWFRKTADVQASFPRLMAERPANDRGRHMCDRLRAAIEEQYRGMVAWENCLGPEVQWVYTCWIIGMRRVDKTDPGADGRETLALPPATPG